MKIAEINALDNTVVERDATADELAQREADKVERDARTKAEKAQQVAEAKIKAALLDRLGITADEAKLLLS